MKYDIYFAVACNTGKIRYINQDNFWYEGKYLEAKNNGLKTVDSGCVTSGQNPAFAVFDGMGGEQYGEIAAYLAAKTFDEFYRETKVQDIRNFLREACLKMNGVITASAAERRVENMGTTGAMIMCGEEEIYICNIGDSKIYQYHKKKLAQVSKDHVVDIFKNRKPPLSQFLGIPEKEFMIEPFIASDISRDGDYYLICSDGLTDMVPDAEIKNIIDQSKDVKSCVEILLENALANGGRDNITIILCEIRKQSGPGAKTPAQKTPALVNQKPGGAATKKRRSVLTQIVGVLSLFLVLAVAAILIGYYWDNITGKNIPETTEKIVETTKPDIKETTTETAPEIIEDTLPVPTPPAKEPPETPAEPITETTIFNQFTTGPTTSEPTAIEQGFIKCEACEGTGAKKCPRCDSYYNFDNGSECDHYSVWLFYENLREYRPDQFSPCYCETCKGTGKIEFVDGIDNW